MSKKRGNKKDLDDQFEAFLKDSFSSEDSVQINKYFETPKKKKDSNRPWWDVDDGEEELGTGRSFLKKKTQKNGKKKADQPVKTAPVPKTRKEVKQKGKAEIQISKDSLDDSLTVDVECSDSDNHSAVSERSDEDHNDHGRPRVHIPDDSRDSMDTDELLNYNYKGSPAKVGMDTLDELADKEKFFQDLEQHADGTIDYGQLNRDLSATGYTMSPDSAAKNAATLAAIRDLKEELGETDPPQPSTRGDVPHSEKEQSEQKPSMLSKVSLMDSLESTMNTTTSPHVGKSTLKEAQDILEERDEEGYGDGLHYRTGQSMPETLKTATGVSGLMGTNTSQEMEALHKALERVGLSATIGNDSQLELSIQGDRGSEDLVKKLLNDDTGKQRSVAEIMKELEDLQKKVATDDDRGQDHNINMKSPRGMNPQMNIAVEEDMRGFALSPAQPSPWDQDHNSHSSNISNRGESHRGDNSHRGDSSHRGGFDTSHTEETEMYQPVTHVSVSDPSRERVRDKKKTKKINNKPDLDKQTRKVKDKKESSLRRSRSSSPLKIDFSDTAKNKFKSVKSSGYGQVWSPPKPPRDRSRDKDRDIIGYSRKPGSAPSRDRPTAQSPSKEAYQNHSPVRMEPRRTGDSWSPVEVTKQKIKGSQSAKQAKLGTVATNQLDASIESFARYIKDHFSKPGQAPEAKYSMDEPTLSASFKDKTENQSGEELQKKEELIARLQGELESLERSYERQLETQKLEYEQQIAQLKQENFVLAAKVSGDEGTEIKQRVLNGDKLDSVTPDQLAALQKELKEQETLIAGYQQENKRLYGEMKNLQKQSKQVEERMFKENQKLLAEASNLRKAKHEQFNQTQLEQKEDQYRNKGVITGIAAQQQIAAGNKDGVISNLESELVNTKRTVDAVNREMMVLQQTRVELEKHVEKLVLEREELKKKLEESKTMKSEEARELESKYNEEIEKLKKKLKWYAENQELLDKGTKKLKVREDDIHKLKMRIEELQTESGKRVEDSKVRARERAADAKKIQDLQRQVKEMEQILKRRNPNSLPSLMIAAAAAPEANPTNNRSAYTEVLEQRVKKLEKELDEKDGETEKLIRGVEQKYNSIKLQFEDRIKDLELQLSIYQGQSDHVHPHTHAVALERELESVRERYKVQVKDLQAEVDRLMGEMSKSKKNLEASLKTELKSAKDTETELQALVKSLQVEVENKNHDLQVMQKSLERLRKEKQLSFTDAGKKQKLKGKPGKADTADDPEFHSLPVQPSSNEKEYEPKVFEDTHISDVIKENEELKTKVDRLQLQVEQQRVDVRKALAEGESILRKTRENYEEEIEALRHSHQSEVKKILANQALEHSTSRMAELQNKVDTQEVMIKHLREQQARLEVEAEAASVLRIKQKRLEETIKSIHMELKEAKKSHTPEMRHFEALQDKIVQIENKHQLREQELQQIIRNSKNAASAEVEEEVEKWRKVVDMKNNEIQRFRVELDSILEVLRVLQKQGVVIPVASTAVS